MTLNSAAQPVYTILMRMILPLVLTVALMSPALAQETPEPPPDDDAQGLMQRGFELFLDGLRDEMAPSLEEMEDLARRFGPSMSAFLEQMGPALARLMDRVDDWTRYEVPEMLPNGDIIIRRKPDLPEKKPPFPGTSDDEDPIEI